MKGSKWEGGVRVPAAVRWPGHITPGTRFTPIVSSMDFTATAVALAGGPIDGAAPLDGRSLFPALAESNERTLDDSTIHPYLFWERGPAAAVRAGEWKLITVADGPTTLYHIPADPSETTDLATEQPEAVDVLTALLNAWRREMAAPLWTEGERWERNQRLKHDPSVLGREAERRLP